MSTDPAVVTDPGHLVTVLPALPTPGRPTVSPCSAYVFWCWVPVLGTLTVAVGQRFAMAAGSAEPVSLRTVGADVGHPGMRGGAHHPIVKAVRRLEYFGLATLAANHIEIDIEWPVLTDRLAAKLPEPLRWFHDRIAGVV